MSQPGGKVIVTDGPYLETKKHIGGFLIIDPADMDEAIAWAQKGTIAGRILVEVRHIFFKKSEA